jgi:hypothetical protein
MARHRRTSSARAASRDGKMGIDKGFGDRPGGTLAAAARNAIGAGR